MEIVIERYSPEYETEWNMFVSAAKNGTFLFYRDFIDYHSDRFSDHSLLFLFKKKLVAILPANIDQNTLYSHQGLTYGGLVLSPSISVRQVLEIFDALIKYLKNSEINRLVYKSIPPIYHTLPSEEDLYALFRNKATLIGRSISSCIFQDNRLKYSQLRERQIKRAAKHELSVKENNSFSEFWNILEDNLKSKFNVRSTHSLKEIEYLKSRFPNNIHLFEVSQYGGSVLGGCVIFETARVAHVQYISASEQGRRMGALDLLFDHLINNTYAHKSFFEFGISTENNGEILNEGLISQKEGFGGRGIVYDIYQLIIP